MKVLKEIDDGASKTTSAGTTYFLYDQGNPIVELNSSGSVTAFNIFAPDGLVARTAFSTTTEYVFDQQGNVVNRTNTSGANVSVTQYDAYGTEHSAYGSPSDPFAYNGQWGYYLDRETGLYNCQNRYYDPGVGRWLNRDPIGFGGGTNLYGYCSDGPAGWADRAGLMTPQVAMQAWADGLVNTDDRAGYMAASREGLKDGLIIDGFLVLTFLTFGEDLIALAGAVGGEGAAASGPLLNKLAEAEEDVNAGESLETAIASGEPEALQLGNSIHAQIQQEFVDLGQGWRGEYVIKGFGRADLVNPITREIIEIKPENARGTCDGLNQLDKYMNGMSSLTGDSWSGYLLSYPKR